MVSSAASTVDEYVAKLPDDRRLIISTLREVVLHNLQPGFVEAMSFGMPCYEVPLAVSGPTYNGKPLVYMAMASQKQSVSLYLTPIYLQPEVYATFATAWVAAVGKFDAGKSCVRVRSLAEVPLDVVAWIAGLCTPEQFVARSVAARGQAPHPRT